MTARLDTLIARDGRPNARPRSPDSIDPDIRSEYERDVDRVFYNYYFRRLADITQVSSGHDKILRHNRMTHSLKVAQVGRRLVQYLKKEDRNKAGIVAAGGIDPDVVFAAGLLHDIGHPPFGHVGEEQLNRLARAYHLDDGFEGNAQTLRVIVSLTTHHQRGERGLLSGLNLTNAVTAACVKYPFSRRESSVGRKWGYYEPEAKFFQKNIHPLLPAERTPTLEAEIMDWADDITYAVHDLQDFYTDGIIPLHHLRHRRRDGTDSYEPIDNSEFSVFWQYVTEKIHKRREFTPSYQALQKFATYASKFPEGKYDGTRKEMANIGALASMLISDASKATSVRPDGRLYIEPNMLTVINALKEVTWFYVIDRPNLVSVQIGQRARIDEMFVRLYKWVEFCFKRKNSSGAWLTPNEQWILQRRLPVQLREFTEQLLELDAGGQSAYAGDHRKCYARAVVDYIASMTEIEFDRMWRRICPGDSYAERDSRIDSNIFEEVEVEGF